MGLLIGVGQTRPQFAYDYYYGIEWDVTVSNPKPTRIGKMELHQSLPIQSLMRRCILNDDGSVNYYLNANNSALRDNSAAATLDGSHGQVMVEIPDMYVRFEREGNKCRCFISDQPLPGFIKWAKSYISAYEATIDRTVSGTFKLASVVNTTPEFRGGANTGAEIAHDADGGTLLGKPSTNVSLTNFRDYARNRGAEWNCNTYQSQVKLWWLFAVEYANFNSQDTFIGELTGEGFRQGGLGAGVTDLVAGSITAMTGGTYSCIPCGITNELGNKTGIVAYAMPSEYGSAKTTDVPSYRGVENPFGHLWKWTDGCKCLIQADGDGGLSEFYVCDDPTKFTSSGVADYELRGNLPRENGYIKEVILGEYGEIMPLSIGGGSTTYFCDQFYTAIPSSGVSERGVLFGGNATYGATAGFVCSNTTSAASSAIALIGSRLCFIPGVA